MACILRKHKDICSSFLIYKEVTSLLTNIPQEKGISIARNAIYVQFSKETFSVIMKRTLYSNGICQSLPEIMGKKYAKASLSHITNMEEMNKSNKVITYLSSGWPLRVSMALMTSHYIMHLSEEQQAFVVS